MGIKEINLAEFGYEAKAFGQPDGTHLPEPMEETFDGHIPVLSLQWRPTLVLGGGAPGTPDEITITPILPLSAMSIDENSTYSSEGGRQTTTYELLTRIEGPKLAVGARYQVPFAPLPNAKFSLGAEGAIGYNSYVTAIEESVVADGRAERTFRVQGTPMTPSFSSVDASLMGAVQMDWLAVRGGVTWDSYLGAAPVAGMSLDLGKLGDKLSRKGGN